MRYRLSTEHADYIVDGTEKWFVRHPNSLDGTLMRHGDGERVPFEDCYIPQPGEVGWFLHWIDLEVAGQSYQQLKSRETEVITDIEMLGNNTPAQEAS